MSQQENKRCTRMPHSGLTKTPADLLKSRREPEENGESVDCSAGEKAQTTTTRGQRNSPLYGSKTELTWS